MDGYRYQVPGSYLRKLVDKLARHNTDPNSESYTFQEVEAVIDLMLAQDRGDLKPYRYYAKRWNWKIGM